MKTETITPQSLEESEGQYGKKIKVTCRDNQIFSGFDAVVDDMKDTIGKKVEIEWDTSKDGKYKNIKKVISVTNGHIDVKEERVEESKLVNSNKRRDIMMLTSYAKDVMNEQKCSAEVAAKAILEIHKIISEGI